MMDGGTVRNVELDRDGFPSRSSSQAVSKPVWHIPFLCVQWKTPDDGQNNCPKHVEYYSKKKFDKFVRLVGFIMSHYSFCVLDFLLSACRPNFAVAANTLQKFDNAWSTECESYNSTCLLNRGSSLWIFSNEWLKGKGYVTYALSRLGETALEMRGILKTNFGDNILVKTQTLSGFLCSHEWEL